VCPKKRNNWDKRNKRKRRLDFQKEQCSRENQRSINGRGRKVGVEKGRGASWMGWDLHSQPSLLPINSQRAPIPHPKPLIPQHSQQRRSPLPPTSLSKPLFPCLSFYASLFKPLFPCLSSPASLPLPLFPCLSFSASLSPVHQRSKTKRFDVIAKEAERQRISLIRAKERLRNESMLGAGCFCD